jgi:hypothetical protein
MPSGNVGYCLAPDLLPAVLADSVSKVNDGRKRDARNDTVSAESPGVHARLPTSAPRPPASTMITPLSPSGRINNKPRTTGGRLFRPRRSLNLSSQYPLDMLAASLPSPLQLRRLYTSKKMAKHVRPLLSMCYRPLHYLLTPPFLQYLAIPRAPSNTASGFSCCS